LNDRARLLRRSSTAAESVLWQQLRVRNQFGVKFRRQRPIGPYIVDFYCPDFGLVIEVDGAEHTLTDNAEYDRERSAYLTGRGLVVLRFTNEEVLIAMESVLGEIRKATPPSP
jgi:ATP-dependent helicase HrpA/adenine-specific DNA-methyltransferase